MARLIDADLLKETIKNPPIHCSLGGITIEDVLTMIDEQPTAYDVEKVVEELEEATQYVKHNGIETYVRALHPIQAIEIVRKGGVE